MGCDAVIEIEQLHVEFAVEGDDADVFAALFARHMAAWSARQAALKRERRQSRADREILPQARRAGDEEAPF